MGAKRKGGLLRPPSSPIVLEVRTVTGACHIPHTFPVVQSVSPVEVLETPASQCGLPGDHTRRDAACNHRPALTLIRAASRQAARAARPLLRRWHDNKNASRLSRAETEIKEWRAVARQERASETFFDPRALCLLEHATQ